MSKNRTYKVRHVDAKQIKDYYLQELQGCGRKTIRLHTRVLNNLLFFLGSKSRRCGQYLSFSEHNLFRWMVDNAKDKNIAYFATHLSVINRYIEQLCVHGVISENPLHQIKPVYNRPGWRCIVQALQSHKPMKELKSLHITPPQHGPLYHSIQKYIKLQRSLGKNYGTHNSILCDFDFFLADHKISSAKAIQSEHIFSWLAQMQCNKAVRKSKATLVKRFFDYLNGLGIMNYNPASLVVIELGPAPQKRQPPFIFSKAQVTAILKHAKQLRPNHRFKLRPQVCYTMLALLYALGLRSGEARKLRFCNVDMEQHTLRIEGTKFYKSRLVPFGPKIHRCLTEYMAERKKIFVPIRSDEPLFITSRRRPIGSTTLSEVFHLLTTSLKAPPSQLPRLYDLRHTFAVHRLLRWYREGADVQSKLVLLSTFMGHTTIFATEVYLTITMDLLKEANKRFYQNFGILIGKENSNEK